MCPIGERELRPAQTALDFNAVGTELEFNGCPGESVSLRKLGRPGQGYGGRHAAAPDASQDETDE